MGNCSCIDRSAVVSWADDDDDGWDEWERTAAGAGSLGTPGKKPKQQQPLKERLLSQSPGRAEDPEHQNPAPAPAADTATQEVKIKISKRQLEELVRKAGGGGDQGFEGLRRALEGLLGSGGWDWEQVAREAAKAENAAGHGHGHGNNHWRPNLQSIPEGAE